MAHPSASLSFSRRHPILKQAVDDAIHLSWQQIGIPVLGTLGNLFVTLLNDYNAHRLDVTGSLRSLAFSLGIGIALYVLVAVVRAPFVVIGRQNRQLFELSGKVSEISTSRGDLVPTRAAVAPEIGPRVITKTVEVEPNIQALAPEMLDAHRQDDDVIVSGGIVERLNHFWDEESKNLGALVIPFQNRIPDGEIEIGTADDISGRLTVRSYESNQTQEINRVAWLDEEESRVYFGRNDTHRLIVFTLEGTENDPHVYSIHKQATGTRRGGDKMGRSELRGTGLFNVRISLLDESKSKGIKKSDYIVEITREPEFNITIDEANRWRKSRLLELSRRGMDLFKDFDYSNTREDALRPEMEKLILESRAFVEQHFGEREAKSLGISPAEYDALPSIKKAFNPNRSFSAISLDFLGHLSKLL